MNKRNKSKENYWFFPRMSPSSQRGKTITSSNFTREDKDLIDIFFREYIQNVMDARVINSVGERQNAFLSIKILDLKADLILKYHGDIEKRLIEAGHSKERLKNAFKSAGDQVSCLIIEEEGTTGLRGETQDSEPDGAEEQWNSFWIGEGNENKSGKDLGRRGEGKIVKHLVSSLSTLFGITNQQSGKKDLLMGKCVFQKYYKYENLSYQRYAYFCDKKDINGETQQIPIQDPDIIKQFKKDFNITRTTNDGTSWVIPAINKNSFKIESIVKAIISEFYIAITKGELSLDIDGQRIDQSNLMDVIEQFQVFDANTKTFVEWIINSIANRPNYTQVDHDWFVDANAPANSDKIQNLDVRKKFNDNETISLSIPIIFQRINEASKYVNLDVFIKNNTDFKMTRGAYIRDCLIIDKEEQYIKNTYGKFFGLALANEDNLIDFLGDAESPSHLEWNQKEPKLAEKYLNYQQTLTQVRRSVPAFLKLFSEMRQDDYEDIFIDLLSVPIGDGKKKKKRKPITPTPITPHQKRTPVFEINQTGGKVEIKSGSGASQVSLPGIIKIEFAYSLLGEKGNPFKEYHHFDFDLADKKFKFNTRGCNIKAII